MKRALFLLFSIIATPVQTQIWYLFSHGVAATLNQANKYAKAYKIGDKIFHNARYTMDSPFSSFNYPDVLKQFPHINPTKTSFAQNNEILHLKLAVEKTIQHAQKKEPGNHAIILVGISRGASAILNLMALDDLPTVKALVLESPFDSVASIIDNKRKQLHLEWLSHDMGELIMETIFRQYKRDGIQPIHLISGIRKDLPILIICSKEDQLVPCQSSIKLYKKLKESGHNDVHLFIANYGKHSKILMGQDGDTYQKVVQAFYAKYGFPHDTELALKGMKYLS
jgi:alpha-beta hydrolase superfamily lysophospholipase